MPAAVRAIGISKTYGRGAAVVRALDNVDFEIAPGTIVALLGPSGSGKSTLIKALGLVLADEPTAALDSTRGRSVMELFRNVAHERGSAVLVVTHDHRALDVFDVRKQMEDGRIDLTAPLS